MGAKYRVLEHPAINEYGDYFRPGYGDAHTRLRIGQIVEASEDQSDLHIFKDRPAVRVAVGYGSLEIPLDVLEGPLANWEVELLADPDGWREYESSDSADPWDDSAYDEYDDSPAEEHDGSEDAPAFEVGDRVDWVYPDGGQRANGYWDNVKVIEQDTFNGEEAYHVERADGGTGLILASQLRLSEPFGVVGGEATAITDGIVRLPEGMKPAPRDGGYLVIDDEIAGTYDKPVKSDSRGLSYSFSILPYSVDAEAPSLADFSKAIDISDYVTDFSFTPIEPEAVDHPSHYGGENDVYEVIKVIEAWGLGYHLGNALKYIRRAGVKNPETEAEDLRKAAWHLNRKADNLEAN